MLKRSLLIVGAAGVSLLAAAAEPAPNARNADAPTVTAEETITIVAVPCPDTAGQCGTKDPKKCADKDKKKCAAPCDAKKKCEVKNAAATADYSDGDYDLAYCLMEAGGVPAGIDDANGFIILEQMEQMPMLKPAQPAFEKFFDKHCSYKAMKRDLARIHLETFTRDEMRKIIDFFHSPAGRKLAASQSDLTRRTLALRADRIHRNLPELQQGVHDCMANAQQNNAAATTQAAVDTTENK